MADSLISNRPKLNPGQTIVTERGQTYTIEKFLGAGGQGEVYRIHGNGGSYALKWYYADRFLSKINAKDFYRNLKRNVDNGVPQLSAGDTATQFIWPLELVPQQNGSFGYIMKLFEPQYESLTHVIMGRKKDKDSGQLIPLRWSSWFTLITAALNIVKAFEILHSVGLSYQDLNEGGISIDIKTGNVMICDCDNVSPDGVNLGIRGVMNYMAPEVVTGQALPDVQTDEYSLAVILFRLFYHNHPMCGIESVRLHSDENITDADADLSIYGKAPHYCLDFKNPVNAPHKTLHADVCNLIKVFPSLLLDSFYQVFTKGIKDRNSRLTCTEWRKVLLQIRDELVLVKGMEKFCHTPADNKLPAGARILRYSSDRHIVCMPGKILYACHMDEYSKNFSTPVAKIIETNKPGVIGLYNASGTAIPVLYEGKTMVCENNGKMPILAGMRLKFGKNEMLVE